MNNFCEFSEKKHTNNYPNKIIKNKKYKTLNTNISYINLTSKNIANLFKKDVGKYTNIIFNEFSYFSNKDFNFITTTLKKEIEKYIKDLNLEMDNITYFIVGLGNHEIEADKLGYMVAKKIISTNIKTNEKNKFFGNVFSLSPSTASNNGVYTAEIIKAVTNYFNPDIIFLIDSMSCKNIEIIAKTIQISNVGFTPGGEIQNKQPSITKGYLSKPVITIGCPLVSDLKNINNKLESKILTIKDISIAVEKFATIIAYTVNKLIHKNLTDNEIIFLMKDL